MMMMMSNRSHSEVAGVLHAVEPEEEPEEAPEEEPEAAELAARTDDEKEKVLLLWKLPPTSPQFEIRDKVETVSFSPHSFHVSENSQTVANFAFLMAIFAQLCP